MDFDKKLKENVKIDIKRYKSAPKQDQIIHSQNHELLRRLDFDTRAAKKKIKRIANMGGIRASKTMYNPKASTAARAEGHSRYYNIYEKSSTRSISNLPNLAEKSQLTSKSQTKKGESSSHRKKNKTSRNSPRKAKIKRRKMNSEKEPTSITKLNKSKNSVHGLRRNKTSQKHKNIEKRGKGFSHKKSTFLTSTNTIPKSNFHLTLNSFNNNNLGKNPYNGNAAHYSTNPNNRSNNWMAATQRSISKGYFSPIEDDSSFSALQFKDANINNNPFFKPKPKVQNHQAKTIMTLIREADTLYGNLGGRAGILDRPNLNNFKETMKSRKHVDQMLSKARSQTKIGSIPQIRNISFLNSSMQISKKKKTTFLNDIERGRGSLDPKMEHKSIPFLKQMTNSSVKLTLSDLPLEADKLQDILMIDNFPRLESKLFEVMKNIKLSYYQQERVRERVESLHFGEGVPSCRKDDFILKYIEGYKIKGCSDRADHLQLLKWLNLAKEKHKLNSCSSKRHSEIEDVVDYVRDKGRIIGFFAKQIIELEEQRCREAAMSTKKLYTECVDMFNSFAMFIQVAMQELDKGSHYKLDLIKLKYEDDMKELKLETKQQKEQIAELEQRIKELNRKGRVFRKRIANDFLTKKWLKADLISASEYLTILRAENKKIGYIIDDMVKDIKMINPASQMIERIGIQLSDISGLKKKYKKELVYLDHHSEVKVDEDNFKGKKRMNTREIDRIQSQLGLEFDDEEMADFVTREIGVVTDDIRDSHLKKVACCQAGPEGYADFSANVDFIDCQKCVFHLAKIRSLQARLGAVKEDKKALEKDYELLEETVQKFKIEAKKKIRRASTLKKRKKRKKKAKNLTDRGKNKGIREGLDLKFPFDLDSPRAGDNESLGSSIRVPSIIQGAIAPVGDTLGTNRSHFNTEYKNQTSVHPSGACDFGDEELSEFSQDSSYLSEGDLEWANITLEGHLNQKLNDYYKSCVVNLSSKKLLFAVSDKRYLKLSKEVSKFRKLIDNFISKRHKDEKHGKRSRKNLSSQKRLPGRRKSIRPPVENLSKKRFNDMVSLANSLFNEFLHSVKKGDGQPPEDVMVMRDKSLWKFLTHLYKEYKTGLEKGAVKTPSLVIFVFSSIRDKNSLKKNLVKKFQSVSFKRPSGHPHMRSPRFLDNPSFLVFFPHF